MCFSQAYDRISKVKRTPTLAQVCSVVVRPGTGGPSSLCEFKMAVNIKDLYGNSGKRFKSINTS